ncbi:TPA: hypothetical protein ACH3X1_014211 [Trebouxia sp. C0004]
MLIASDKHKAILATSNEFEGKFKTGRSCTTTQQASQGIQIYSCNKRQLNQSPFLFRHRPANLHVVCAGMNKALSSWKKDEMVRSCVQSFAVTPEVTCVTLTH